MPRPMIESRAVLESAADSFEGVFTLTRVEGSVVVASVSPDEGSVTFDATWAASRAGSGVA